MLQFKQPALTLPARLAAPAKNKPIWLDPRRTHIFASTHIDVGGCSYYRILFISQLLSQIYDQVLFNDARLLYNNRDHFPLLTSFRLQRACSTKNFDWFNKVLLPAKNAFHFPVVYEIDYILVLEDIPVYNCYRDIFREG